MTYNLVFVFHEIGLVLVNHYIFFRAIVFFFFCKRRSNFFCFVLSNVYIVWGRKGKRGKERRSRRVGEKKGDKEGHFTMINV